jgi:hypothetical protein
MQEMNQELKSPNFNGNPRKKFQIWVIFEEAKLEKKNLGIFPYDDVSMTWRPCVS